jgi:succinate dehydrogenase / fumarate reductase, cytochrome b subunit
VSSPTMLDRYQTSATYLARILHRLSGLILTVYVLAYIWELGSIVRGGEQVFNATMAGFNTGFWRLTHALVIALVVLHALTGLRVLLFEAGVGLKFQRASFWISLLLTLVLFVLLFIHIVSKLAA